MENDLLVIIDTFKQCQELEITDENSDTGKGLFYMEKQLEDFIIHNQEETELGKRYNLIFEEGELKSQQYRTAIGIIDILAKNKIEDNFVVIDSKETRPVMIQLGRLLDTWGG